MNTYTASRLSEGNRVFPSRLVIDNLGVTLIAPGIFSSNEKTIPYNKIASVKIDCPLAGYSTVILETTGEGSINAHGFTKDEVREIKKIILDKLN